MKKNLLSIILCLWACVGYATNYYSLPTGNLDNLSTWGSNPDGSGAPPPNFASGDVFNIVNNATPTIGASWTVSGAGSKIIVGDGSMAINFTIPSSLAVTGTVDVSALSTLTVQGTTGPLIGNATSGTVIFSGTGAQTIAGGTYGSLVVSGARTGSPTITFGTSTSSTINVSSLSLTATGVGSYTSTGTINYSNTAGGVTILSNINYYNLQISNTSGTNTVAGNLNITNTLTTTAGGSLDMGIRTLSAGAINNGGTILTQNLSAAPLPSGKDIGGTVVYNAATGNQSIVFETSYQNLTLGNTSGTDSAKGGDIIVNGLLTTTAGGTLNMGTGRKISGSASSVLNNGTITTSVPTTTSAVPFFASKVWNGAGKVIYARAAGAQTIAVGTYNCRLQLSNTSGINAVAAGAITINDSFITTGGGTVTFTSGNQMLGTVKPRNNGTIITGATGTPLPAGISWGGSVKFSLAGQSIASGTFSRLTFSNTTGKITAIGDLTINDSLFTTSGGSLDMDVYQMQGTPFVTNNGTVLTLSSANPALPVGRSWSGSNGVVTFSSTTGGQFIPTGTYKTLNNSHTSGTNTVVGGNLVVTGTFKAALAGGSLDMGTGALSAGTVTLVGATLFTQNTSSTPLTAHKVWGNTSSGTVVYNGTAGQTIVAGTYMNLQISGTRTGSPVISFPTDTIVVRGDYEVTATGVGSYSLGTNTFMFSGATSGNVAGMTYHDLIFLNTSAGPKTATGDIVVTNKLQTIAGATFSLGAFTLGGALTTLNNNGTIKTFSTSNPPIPAGRNWEGSGTTGTVEYGSLTGGQFVPAGTYKNLKFDQMSDTNTVVGDLNVTGTLTVGPVGSTGAVTMGTNLLASVTTLGTGDGTLITQNTSSLPIPRSKTWRGPVVYNAAGSQTIVYGTYKDIVLGGVRIGTPTITLDGPTIIKVSRNFTANYTGALNFAVTNSTVQYNGVTDGTIAPINYGNLYISSASGAIKTALGNIGVQDTLTLEAGGIFNMSTYQMTGTLSNVVNRGVITTMSTSNPALPTGTNWSLVGGTVEFASPTGGQFIPAGIYSSIKVDDSVSGKDTVVGNIVMNNGVLTDSGVLDFGPATLSGSFDTAVGNGTIITANISANPLPMGMMWGPKVVYNNAAGGQTIVPGSYNGGLTNSNTSGVNFVMSDSTVNVAGMLTLSAGSALSDSGGTINLSGNIVGTGTHTGSGKINMNGTSSQSISGATLGNLQLNNTSGFTLTGNPTVNGTLTLTNGVLDINNNNFNFGATAGAVAGTPGTSSMIISTGTGEVRKMFAGIGSFLFPIGDNGPNYSPVALNFTDGTFGGGAYAGVKVKNVKHPLNSNLTDFINRYWSISTSGITAPVYDIDATYAEGDIVGTESLVTAAKLSTSLPWIKYGATNATTDVLSATGIVDMNFDFTGISGVGPVVTVTPTPAEICSGGSIVLDASGTTGVAPLTYSWSPATGLSATTGSTVTATLTSAVTISPIYTVTVTDGNGISTSSTVTVTVNALATAIGGATNVCEAATTTLTNATTGGTWVSSDGAIATIGSSDGLVTGVVAGIVDITYTAPGGCDATTTLTVYPIPTAITGSGAFCTGATATFTNGVAGGTWTSGNTSIATVGSTTGDVLAVGVGNTLISYTVPNGCGTATKAVTVDLAADAGTITGASSVLTGSTITLSDAAPGGVWSASNSNASVSPLGVVTGLIGGVVDISYTVTTSCGSVSATKTITVNATISGIAGTLAICVGGTTALSDATPGGLWTSSGSPTIITIASTTGFVTGISAGTAMITYGGPGNYTYAVVTVNPLPTPITGGTGVCVGSTVTLSNTITGGTWISSNTSFATIDMSTGLVTGIGAGSATITYTLPTGCMRTSAMIVKPVPAAIVGSGVVCVGGTTVLTDPTSGGVSWTSSNSSIASIGATSGVVTGIAPGTATITFTVISGCVATTVMTVNAGLPAITGTLNVCIGSTTTLGDPASGGSWSSSPAGIASIGSATGTLTGLIAGTAVVTYSIGSCRALAVATVNSVPAAIFGSPGVCIGSSNTLSDATTGGTWSSSASGIASVGASTGVLTGVSAGNATISYTTAMGCSRTIIATVSAAPTITGATVLCVGNVTTLGSSVPGGTWTSSNTSVASIVSATGVLTGLSLGNSNITYTYSPTCKASVTVTVGTAPAVITGPTAACAGSTITLSSATSGGAWTSSNTGIATVVAGTGVVTGVASGTAVISYAVGAGCYQVKTIQVGSGLGSITGNTGLCIGATTTYISTSPSTGVGWSSSNTSVASVGAASGVVSGVSAGTANITFTPYAFSAYAGCTAVKTVTVDAVPSVGPITGPSAVHVGSSITLADITPGGVWLTGSAAASITSTGVLTGLAAPAVIVGYRVTNGGCVFTVTKLVTVTTNKPGIVSVDEFAVYPNPTSGTFTVSAPVAGTFTVYSLEGREVMRTAIVEGLNPINMPNGLAAGVYMCRFNGEDESSVMVRLVFDAK